MNMGAYFHVAPRMKTCLLEEGRSTDHQMPYVGRPPCASTATGFGKVSSCQTRHPVTLLAACMSPRKPAAPMQGSLCVSMCLGSIRSSAPAKVPL